MAVSNSVVGAAQPACLTPAARTAVRKAILDTLRADDHNPMGVPVYKVNAIRVCDGWAYVDASPCYGKGATECAEGGWSLLRQKKGAWKLLPTPKDEACDAMNATFGSPGDDCLKILKRREPDLPMELFRKK